MDESKIKTRLAQSISWLKEELSTIRVGRATTGMVANIQVDAYEGVPLPLQELATLTTPEPRQIVVQPWDKSVIPAIEKALAKQRDRFSSVVDDPIIRIFLPPLSEERREEIARLIGEKVEDARVRMRYTRDDIRKEIKTQEKEGLTGEDQKFRWLEKVDELAKEIDKQIKDLGEKKKQAIMQ